MVEIQFFYRIDTQQIDAVYKDCKTNSTKYKNTDVYMEINVTDPTYDVTRDHKVVPDQFGNIVGTTANPNPDQPTPQPNPYQSDIDNLNTVFTGSGTPDKLDALKEVLLKLLGD